MGSNLQFSTSTYLVSFVAKYSLKQAKKLTIMNHGESVGPVTFIDPSV